MSVQPTLLGFIGTGVMGAAMAARLQAAGHALGAQALYLAYRALDQAASDG